MSNKISLLDCTLRDGAYIVNAKFGSPVIRGIISHMQRAKAEVIECGWLKNAEYKEGTTFYHTPDDLKPYLFKKDPNVTYTVMIDWDRYELNYLPPYDGESIDAIRVVFPRGKHNDAIAIGKKIRDKGYRLFFQAANTLAYSDEELNDLATAMNEVAPESLSVVDTFGAMFHEDLERIVGVLDKKLDASIKLGFHSHNNQQLSFALSMAFVEMLKNSPRDIVVDASLCGMGRGAGNATTELMASYLNRKQGKNYDMDVILDAIDVFMEYFKHNYSWGYSTPYFISGMYCTHVNNIAYLTEKHRTNAKDMKGIIESLPPEKRLVYDYDLLEQKYLQFYQKNIDNKVALADLRKFVDNRAVLMLCSGRTLIDEKDRIERYIEKEKPIIIGINMMLKGYDYDCCFFTNPLRYAYAMMDNETKYDSVKQIITSNVKNTAENDNEIIVDFGSLIKSGWKYFDNAGILCLRLLHGLGVKKVAIAGFDGFGGNLAADYANKRMPAVVINPDWNEVNNDIKEMLADFCGATKGEMSVHFVTDSMFGGADDEKTTV